jgi:hypothetical protein
MILLPAASRVLKAYRRYTDEEEKRSEEEKEVLKRKNEMEGFKKEEGVVVVYGTG